MAKSKKVAKIKGAVTQKTIPFIHALCKLTDEERQGVIKYLNKDGRDAIYECVRNCIYNKSISKEKRFELKKSLQSKSKIYKYLAKPGNSSVRKRKVLLQRQTGEGLGLILSALLPILLSAILPKK